MLALVLEGRKHLLGLELQSANDMKLPLRMAEYALRTYRLHNEFPDQHVLYLGDEEMRMPTEISGPNFFCRYKIFDIRSLDEETLLNSPFATDSIVAILTGNRDRRKTVQRILQRIATLEVGRREEALKKLLILSGLREAENLIRTELKHMPILNDIMDHKVLGPTFRDGERTIIRRQIAKRFGDPPSWVDERLAKLSHTELEDFSLRLFDARTLDELFTH